MNSRASPACRSGSRLTTSRTTAASPARPSPSFTGCAHPRCSLPRPRRPIRSTHSRAPATPMPRSFSSRRLVSILAPRETNSGSWYRATDANYGGAQIFVSTDGGSSYNPAPGGADGNSNIVIGSAVTGQVVTATGRRPTIPTLQTTLKSTSPSRTAFCSRIPPWSRTTLKCPATSRAQR